MINVIMYSGAYESTPSESEKKCAAITTAMSPKREASEETFKTFAQNPQTTAPIRVGIGMSTKRTPNPVATPFPPSNHK